MSEGSLNETNIAVGSLSKVKRLGITRRHTVPIVLLNTPLAFDMDASSEDATTPSDSVVRQLYLPLETTTQDPRPKTPQQQISIRSPSKGSESKINKDSIKARKQTYRKEKKRAAKELSSALKDKSVIILSSWLKIRGTLKSWAKFWCVVKPGAMIIYKGQKHENWVGTVLLNSCDVKERPSSKEGFCFKVYHPLKQYMWANKGPKGEIAGSLSIPLPKDHLILRTSSESTGKCWMDALEVAQTSSLVHTDKGMHSDLYGGNEFDSRHEGEHDDVVSPCDDGSVCVSNRHVLLDDHYLQVTDITCSSEDQIIYADRSDEMSSDAEGIEDLQYLDDRVFTISNDTDQCPASNYSRETVEYLGEAGETTEDMGDENKSILWALLKQVRPGMDLSRVTLPTFILEPRSFLDKLADYYYHADILARAAKDDNPYNRMKEVVKWYLSGFYKKPKGLKKPYNPIIGEVFRCVWEPENGAKTYYIAEQVSHHPPVSVFYCSNRQDGFAVSGSILTKSKFYGNSTSAILDGSAVLTFLKLGEDYTVTMPYAHIKGIFIGAITAEMGGMVRITCEKTGYQAEIDFKLKPFWKKTVDSNHIQGKIKLGKDVLSKLEGKWDGEVLITEYGMAEKTETPLPTVFWEPNEDVQKSRLKRCTVDLDEQMESESERLWQNVTAALKENDQETATKEKSILEDHQRNIHRELKEKNEEWTPHFFVRDSNSPNPYVYLYKYRDLRPWDPSNDVVQFEAEGVIKTKARHITPHVVRTVSLVNISKSRGSLDDIARGDRLPTIIEPDESEIGSRRGSADFEYPATSDDESDVGSSRHCESSKTSSLRVNRAGQNASFKEIIDAQAESNKQIIALRSDVRRLINNHRNSLGFQTRDIIIVVILLLFQAFLQFMPLGTKK